MFYFFSNPKPLKSKDLGPIRLCAFLPHQGSIWCRWVSIHINYIILVLQVLPVIIACHVGLGGLPDLSRMPPGSTAGLPVPFAGCIRRLSIDYETITLNYSSIAAGRNIADCDGTPCGGDLCHHGGSCWLDMDMKPHCHCLQVRSCFIVIL